MSILNRPGVTLDTLRLGFFPMLFALSFITSTGLGGGAAAQGGDVDQGRNSYLNGQAMVARIVLSPGGKDEAFLCL